MQLVLRGLGTFAYWILWPVWIVYFRLVPDRSRVLIVADGKLLVLTGWLGDRSWGLPGGGAKKGEPVIQSAMRELYEEIGIQVAAKTLQPLGHYLHNRFGIVYRAHFFLLKLDAVPPIKHQLHEIAASRWVTKVDLEELRINDDARHALTVYGTEIW